MSDKVEEFDRFETLPSVIARRAENHPQRIYLQDTAGRSLTFQQTQALALKWAAALGRAGVGEGDRVGVMLPPCLEAAVVWLGIGWVQGIEVPINIAYRSHMLHYVLQDSAVKILVIEQSYLERLAEVGHRLDSLKMVIVINVTTPFPAGLKVSLVRVEEFLHNIESVKDLPVPKPWNKAGMIYTSGTTGPSKGILYPWGFWTLLAKMFIDYLGPDDAFYAPFPMFHGSGKMPILAMAFAGGRVVIREAFNTRLFWSDIDNYECTFTMLLPTMAQWLLSQPPSPDDTRHFLKHVLMYGNLQAVRHRFGLKVHTSFGSGEAGNPFVGHDVIANFTSCGKIRPDYEVRIVDEYDYDVPVGEVGELLVRTKPPWTMNLGYFGQPEKTLETRQNGWYHTGDAFRCDEQGNYYFVDRKKDYMRRRGENISSFEVEALVTQHPQVAEVAAIGVASEHGEDEIKIVVVLHPGQQLLPEELIAFLIPRMPRFMIPRYIEFVSELPKTDATFRVRKVELRENPLNERTWDREVAGILLPK
jgi:crotonobetaine/carnitine-CoA ligase